MYTTVRYSCRDAAAAVTATGVQELLTCVMGRGKRVVRSPRSGKVNGKTWKIWPRALRIYDDYFKWVL